jgi:uncharacterized protein YggE
MNARLLLALLAFSPIAPALTALAQTPDPCATAPATCATLIETHATAETRIPNTAIDVEISVSATGKTLPEVQRDLANKSNAVLAYLRAQKVDRLITTSVSFSPETRYDKTGPDKTVGYDGSEQVSFRTTPDKAPDLLTGVLTNGANSIDSTSFTPTEEEIADARRKLAEDATRTAIAQADSIAEAAGIKVAAIRNISVDNSAFEPVRYNASAMMATAMAAAPSPPPMNTAAGDQQLSVQVNITAAALR